MKSFTKDILRSVRKSQSRFLAIFGIVALGAGFFCGLNAAGTDMRETTDAYCDNASMMDVEILSTLGFSEDDVKAIEDVKGVQDVMSGYRQDVSVTINDSDETVARFHSLPEDGAPQLNTPVLVEGRMPEKAGECVIGTGSTIAGTAAQVGDKLQLVTEEDNGDETDTGLQADSYTIVGLVETPYYLSFSLGTSSIGSGRVGLYAYVLPDEFIVGFYTDLLLTVDGARDMDAFSGEYEDTVSAVTGRLEDLADTRAPQRREELVSSAQEELDKATKEYEDQKEEVTQQLDEAEQQLIDGQEELDKQADTLQKAQEEIETNEKTLEDTKKQLADGWDQYDAGKEALEQKREEAEEALESARIQLEDGDTAYEVQSATYETAVSTLSQQQEQLESLEQQLLKVIAAIPTDSPDMPPEVAAAIQQVQQWVQNAEEPSEEDIDTWLSVLASYEEKLPKEAADLITMVQDMEKTYSDTKAQLKEAEGELAAAKEQLQQARQTYEQQAADAEEELAAAEETLQASYEELRAGDQAYQDGLLALMQAKEQTADGESQLEEARATLEEKRKEWEDGKKTAEEELQKGAEQLEDAQKQVDDIGEGEWYVLDRDANVGFASMKQDSQRLDSLCTVFPVIFFLVAVLVVLTTMTRYVEEERVLIGTYKALGYGSGRILSKYLWYASVPTVLGCLIGPAIGFFALPQVVWNAYRLMYTVPDLHSPFRFDMAFWALLIFMVSTLAATIFAVLDHLREVPATLMMPRAPKAGKHVLLEHIPFIWKRLSFTRKVTVRNLFRYKKRLIMTVTGITGCTALLLTGFGIKDSISDIVNLEYRELSTYQYEATTEEGFTSAQADSLLAGTQAEYLRSRTVMVDCKAGGDTYSVYLMVPEDTEKTTQFLTFRTREGHTPVPFDQDGVLLSEKLSNKLGVQAGDTITFTEDDKHYDVKVTGVVEHYIYDYIYMAPQVYEKVTGHAPSMNRLMVITDDDHESVVEGALKSSDDITTFADIEQNASDFDRMLQSLNYVVLVIILCAGMLAFIVLYNLTNINVTERQREIATMKVLGFTDREVNAYVYRETLLLTLIGCVFGLALGVVLHGFVINTVEIDSVMFGHTVKVLSFIISAVITWLFSLIVDRVIDRKLKKINMVESLKSVD